MLEIHLWLDLFYKGNKILKHISVKRRFQRYVNSVPLDGTAVPACGTYVPCHGIYIPADGMEKLSEMFMESGGDDVFPRYNNFAPDALLIIN